MCQSESVWNSSEVISFDLELSFQRNLLTISNALFNAFYLVAPQSKTYVNLLPHFFFRRMVPRGGDFIDTRVAIFEREKQKAKMMTKAIKIVSKVWCKRYKNEWSEKQISVIFFYTTSIIERLFKLIQLNCSALRC